MQRVANVWLAFTVLGGIVGIAVFLTGRFVFSVSDWVSVPAAWAIGVIAGFGASKSRWVRRRLLTVLGILSHLRYFR